MNIQNPGNLGIYITNKKKHQQKPPTFKRHHKTQFSTQTFYKTVSIANNNFSSVSARAKSLLRYSVQSAEQLASKMKANNIFSIKILVTEAEEKRKDGNVVNSLKNDD